MASDLKSMVELLRGLAGNTISKQLDEAISTIAADAEAAKTDPSIEQGRFYAEKIEQQIALVRWQCERQHASTAALEALRLCQWWMQLRADAIFAKAMRAYEAQRQRKVTDEQIIQALEKSPTQEDAAAELNITARQIRDRIPKKKREQIKAAKK